MKRVIICLLLLEVAGCDALKVTTESQKATAEYIRGVEFAEGGDLVTAIACFSEAIRLNPDSVEAYRERADAYAKQNELDKAVADYTEAIRLKPDSAELYRARGSVHFLSGQGGLFFGWDQDTLKKGVADYTEAIRLKPDFVAAYTERAVGHVSCDEHDKAIADLTEVIRLDPDCGEHYRNRGIVFYLNGDTAKSEADHDKAKELGYKP